MNRTARALGMNSTTFRNPNGLPDSGQVTTARDLARLGTRPAGPLPELLQLLRQAQLHLSAARASATTIACSDRSTGVDGIKTGYIARLRLQPRHQRRARRPPHHRGGDGRQDRLAPRRAYARADRQLSAEGQARRALRAAPRGGYERRRPSCRHRRRRADERRRGDRRACAHAARPPGDRGRTTRPCCAYAADGGPARRRRAAMAEAEVTRLGRATEGDVSDADEVERRRRSDRRAHPDRQLGRRIRRHRRCEAGRPAIRSRELTAARPPPRRRRRHHRGAPARPAQRPPAIQAGWHIQIGAVPTAEGAAGAHRQGAGLDGPGARLAAAR